MKTFLKIVPSEWKNASRDKREISVAKEIGYNVVIIARKEKNNLEYYIDDEQVIRISTRPFKLPQKLNGLNRLCSVFLWIKEVKAIKADVISCHDIITLIIAYLAVFGTRKKNHTVLIYDSHEFELGRAGRKSKLKTLIIYLVEHFLIKKVDMTMVVNKKIADEIQKIHRLEEKPLVIRNIPEYWILDYKKTNEIREKYFSSLGIDKGKIVLITHGMITEDRGIEKFIDLVASFPEAIGIVLGNGTERYINKLKEKVHTSNAEGRVLFHKAVPLYELKDYISAADVSMILADNSSKSYLWSLPNKLFESIQAETPIICGEFPQMEEILSKYEVGYSLPIDMELTKKAIHDIVCDPVLTMKLKMNLKNAKEILCWENEKNELVKKYKKFYDITTI